MGSSGTVTPLPNHKQYVPEYNDAHILWTYSYLMRSVCLGFTSSENSRMFNGCRRYIDEFYRRPEREKKKNAEKAKRRRMG